MKKRSLSLTMVAMAMGLTVVSLSACTQNTSKYTLDQKVEAIVKQINAEQPNKPVTEEMKKYIREQLAQQEALANAAREKGLDKDETVKVMAAIAAEQALSAKFLDTQMAEFKPSDEELKKIYDEQVNKGKEYHLRHILVGANDEALAKEIIAKLKAGASFEALAKQYSKDPGSANQGGDLGWSPLDAWVKEFKEASEQLQVKQITEQPVKSQFGYHIIQMVDAPRLPENLPAFEAVKSNVLEKARQDRMKQIQDQYKPKP